MALGAWLVLQHHLTIGGLLAFISLMGQVISPVTALTGISQNMVAGQPTFRDQLPRALELMQGALIVGHNVRFDLSFLRREFRRSGADIHP